MALVYPDKSACDAAGVSREQLVAEMEQVRKNTNAMLAAYEQIAKVEILPQEFEKTPKNSIKRYLYK